jgi:hypothetical protein
VRFFFRQRAIKQIGKWHVFNYRFPADAGFICILCGLSNWMSIHYSLSAMHEAEFNLRRLAIFRSTPRGEIKALAYFKVTASKLAAHL